MTVLKKTFWYRPFNYEIRRILWKSQNES